MTTTGLSQVINYLPTNPPSNTPDTFQATTNQQRKNVLETKKVTSIDVQALDNSLITPLSAKQDDFSSLKQSILFKNWDQQLWSNFIQNGNVTLKKLK
jgi:hypothetical protein